MRYRLLAFLILALAGCLDGCGSAEEAKKSDDRTDSGIAPSMKIPLSRYESTFNPADYNDAVEVELQMHETMVMKGKIGAKEDSVYVKSEILQGYRIQIFASPSIDEANAMRSAASQRLGEDSLYVIFDPPVYKVRVGDFRTRIEANQKLGMLVDSGFPDAWVVNDRIVQRRLVRVKPTDVREPKE